MKISYTYILFSLFLAFLPGCELIHDDLPETRADGEPVYIRLQISTGGEMSATRSNPTGGENGDGREPGTDAENAVSNVTLFLFDANVAIDGEESTPLIPLSFSESDLMDSSDRPEEIEQIYTIEKEVRGLSEDSYHILAVANMTFGENEQPTTLGALRDKIITSTPWATDSPTNFVMSSEKLATIRGINASTEQYPATTSITIERLAARVDYQKENSYTTTTDDDNTIEGTVTIEKVMLVNDFKRGEYLFKRVANTVDATSGWTYLTDETSTNGVATNWVVDPYLTKDKVETDYNYYFPKLLGWESALSEGTQVTDQNDQTWYRIGYTMENTNDIQSNNKNDYATGVVFQAKFAPDEITGSENEDGTFYKYDNKLYANLSDINDESLPDDLTDDNCKDYGIVKYPQGLCYYTWWIKHSNDEDNEPGVMEYAIVRNNIYQLKVTSIAGLGDNVPGDESLKIIVAVKKWTMLDTEEVTLTK